MIHAYMNGRDFVITAVHFVGQPINPAPGINEDDTLRSAERLVIKKLTKTSQFPVFLVDILKKAFYLSFSRSFIFSVDIWVFHVKIDTPLSTVGYSMAF